MAEILIVEDSDDLGEVMQMALEAEGHQVTVSPNGRAALNHLQAAENPPRLILLDLMMPIMNGWEFLAIKQTQTKIAEIPVVVCSAAQPDGLDGLGFLKKPVDLDKLLVAVRTELTKIA